jgi:hypothetical protein
VASHPLSCLDTHVRTRLCSPVFWPCYHCTLAAPASAAVHAPTAMALSLLHRALTAPRRPTLPSRNAAVRAPRLTSCPTHHHPPVCYSKCHHELPCSGRCGPSWVALQSFHSRAQVVEHHTNPEVLSEPSDTPPRHRSTATPLLRQRPPAPCNTLVLL